jgi:ribose 5-phosphate isomerase B
MNILCLGGRTLGLAVAGDLVQTFIAAKFSRAPRHLRRLRKVAALETGAVPRAEGDHPA